MDSMAVLLEAAAEDIKLIDCLGPEDLCHDPSSADGLKPVRTLQLCSVTKTTLICSTTCIQAHAVLVLFQTCSSLSCCPAAVAVDVMHYTIPKTVSLAAAHSWSQT